MRGMETTRAPLPPVLLTRREAAKVLNVTTRTLERWERAGRLSPLRNGRLVRYRVEDVQAFFDRVAEAS